MTFMLQVCKTILFLDMANPLPSSIFVLQLFKFPLKNFKVPLKTGGNQKNLYMHTQKPTYHHLETKY